MLPDFIAFVGHPKSGKTTAAEVFLDTFGGEVVDDGHVLRKFAVEELGLSWDDVLSQHGKARTTEILGKTWTNREILGEFGNALEALFGEHILPFIATRHHVPGQTWLFPSCRKTQGAFYRQRGGIVIQIDNPLAGPSGNAFDEWDRTEVDYVINNDGLARDLPPLQARAHLRDELIAVVEQHAAETVCNQLAGALCNVA
jgi:hypothetical protein